MAITASGAFGLSLEKAFIDTLGQSWEAETHKVALISDAATPNFDTMDFWDDLSANEVTGTDWSAGGVALTGTEITLSAGVLTFDATDVSAATTTITNGDGRGVQDDRRLVGHRPADPAVGLRHRVSAPARGRSASSGMRRES